MRKKMSNVNVCNVDRFNEYLLDRIEHRLDVNYVNIIRSSGTTKAYWLLERVDLLKLRDRTRKTIDNYNREIAPIPIMSNDEHQLEFSENVIRHHNIYMRCMT